MSEYPVDFQFGSVSLVVTGSISAALVPHWLHWMRQACPSLQTNVVVTRSAERFVTLEAIRQLTTGMLARVDWDDPLFVRGYAGFEHGSECFGVFPATLNSAMRLANGMCDTPAMMALQMTEKPIAICSTFPGSNVLIEEQLGRLRKRKNVVFADTGPAMRTSSGSYEARTGFSLPALFAAINTANELSGRSDSDGEKSNVDR